MLPHSHFLITGATIAPVAIALYPEKSVVEISKWVFWGGILSAVIDLDVFALVYIRSRTDKRLKPFRNMLNIFRNFKGFKHVLMETGMLKAGMVTHVILSVLLFIVFYFLLYQYFIPAALAILSHMISDLPNVRRLTRGN